MNTNDLQEKLKERLKAELQAYEQAGVPERIYLPKTLLYSALRKQTEISRRISAVIYSRLKTGSIRDTTDLFLLPSRWAFPATAS